jgi:hypothetical protein
MNKRAHAAIVKPFFSRVFWRIPTTAPIVTAMLGFTSNNWIVDDSRYNSLAMRPHFSAIRWRNRILGPLLAVALVPAIVYSARAQSNVYKSAMGYHLTYPSGWQILNAKDRATIVEAGSQLHHSVDLSDVDVIIHAPLTDPIRNINVNVSPYIVPATPYFLDEYKKLLPQQLSKSGASGPPQNLDVRLTTVGRYDAILATWTDDMPGAGRVWEEQFVIAGISHTFIVTCTSAADSSALAAPIFAKILATFQIDKEPPPTGSPRIHQILQEAESRKPENDRIRAALQEILARQPQSFSEFKKQCADLKTALDESDALEKRKRQMLADLRVQFGDDAYVNGLFDELRTMEDLSDKMEPVWRGMIACSRILVSAPSSKQDSYHTICVDPAQQQISLIVPEISTAVQKLQSDIQRFGVSLPPDVLQAIAQ